VSPALRACLFDLDGTLIDSIELIVRSYEHALAAHGMPAQSREEWLAGLGTPLKDQFAQFTRDEREIDALIATYRAFNDLHHDLLVQRYPGAREGVQELHARGVVLGIVTSKKVATAKKGLAHCGFDERWFSTLIGVDSVARHKPHPEPVLKALSEIGVAAHDTLFVGDSVHDLAAGRAAGVRTGAALWGPFPRAWLERERPDVWIEAPGDIGALR
jgi:pyrophosphatase PpaX